MVSLFDMWKKEDIIKKSEPELLNQINKKMEEVSKAEDTHKSGLTSQIEDLHKKLDALTGISEIKKGKDKTFKLPWKVRRQLKVLAKKNKTLVFLLTSNRTIEPLTTDIKNGLVKIRDKIYQCDTPFIYMWMGKFPAIVLPEWSLNPIGTLDYIRAMENKETGVYAQEAIIRAVEQEAIAAKNKMNPRMIIILLVVAAVIGYLFFFK